MNGWSIYLKERFPIATYVVLVGCMALSGVYLGGGGFEPRGFALGFIGMMLFFAELRLMDEYKDFEKDKIANPTRPLPRGVLSVDEVRRGIFVLAGLLVTYALLLFVFSSVVTGALFFLIVIYLGLMYVEFFVGAGLARFPILYGLTHQVIVFPVSAFMVVAARPDWIAHPLTFAYALTALGGFFAYEICRKLDPRAHPVLKTYLSHYGPVQTSFYVLCLLALAAYGARLLGAEAVLWPVEGLLALSLGLIVFKPEKYKVTEAIATLSLLVHLGAGLIQGLLSRFGG